MRLGRIIRSDEFSDILRNGTRSQHRGIVVMHRGSNAGCRLGFAVGRGAGGAVQRNRFRRVIREFLRQIDLPSVDIVISLRTPIRPMTNDTIRIVMTTLLKNNGWLR